MVHISTFIKTGRTDWVWSNFDSLLANLNWFLEALLSVCSLCSFSWKRDNLIYGTKEGLGCCVTRTGFVFLGGSPQLMVEQVQPANKRSQVFTLHSSKYGDQSFYPEFCQHLMLARANSYVINEELQGSRKHPVRGTSVLTNQTACCC